MKSKKSSSSKSSRKRKNLKRGLAAAAGAAAAVGVGVGAWHLYKRYHNSKTAQYIQPGVFREVHNPDELSLCDKLDAEYGIVDQTSLEAAISYLRRVQGGHPILAQMDECRQLSTRTFSSDIELP